MNDEFLERFRAAEAQEFWAVVGVIDPDDPSSCFAYTAGLTELERPELLMVEFRPEHMLFARDVLNRMGARSLDAALVAERIYKIGFDELRVVAREVDPCDPRWPLNVAVARFGQRVRALVLEPVTGETYFPQARSGSS